ncbi:MAG: ADP-ribosylglycohydrolase family protein [Oscillatoriophycideae cyanobacterium NC_groundwater_1537_Pr4_S-0.65um_50_18]|nr:ADP-ribosylglycohydrolase family protein [Oscillatoriophycideae cyanobacterium NC_groundwater_1537_Pr4_S-0.65um_50_18]
MRYTLLSRFQGSFLGAALGEVFAADRDASDLQSSARPSWGKVAIAQMDALTNGHASPSPELTQQLPQPISAAGVAIALLPLALFYHEDAEQFSQQAQQRLVQWQLPIETGMGGLVLGQSIGVILREQCQPLELIPRLLASLDQHPQPSVLARQLTQVQEWLTEDAIASRFSVHKLFADAIANPRELALMETAPIALALYAFLSTPEAFSLSLLRVAQLFHGFDTHGLNSHHLGIWPLAACLTGALSGAYNGRAGLPQDWRNRLRSEPEPPDSKNPASEHLVLENRSYLTLLWEVESETELLEYVHRFIAAWSGMHNPIQHSLPPKTLVTLAAPQIIRPGSRLG